MKKLLCVLFFLTAGSFLNKSLGQDLCSNNPKACKVLSDTAGIKMMLITLPPGAKISKHTHPVNMGYCIKGGLYKWTYDTGKTESYDMKPGESFHGGPEGPHYSWNAGKTTIQFILVEKD